MNYSQTTRYAQIKENEWAVGHPLSFTNFTSCIGIAGRKSKQNGELFGIHLVQATDDFFNEDDAKKVVDLVTYNCERGDELYLFGFLETWEANPAYATLKSGLSDNFQIKLYDKNVDTNGCFTVNTDTITSKMKFIFVKS